MANRSLAAAIRNIFWNGSEQRARALWRVLLLALLIGGLGLLTILLIAEPLTGLHKRGLFLAALNKEAYDRVINIIVGPMLTGVILGSVWVAGRWLDHRRFHEFGLRFNRQWWMDLLFGLALGGGLMGIVFLWEYREGWVTISGTFQTSVPGVTLGLGLVFSITKDLCVGLYEELISRGYLLTNLSEGLEGVARLGSRGAVGASMVLTSALFGALHAFNENSTVFSSANLAFIGIMFAVAYVATGELGLPIGLHISWNFFQGTVFGLAVSGAKEGASVLGIQQAGPALFTGGAFGPEAGLMGTGAAILGIVLIVAWSRNRRRVPFSVVSRVVTNS
jgi:membrane protease YdiL (CAAX protease family)